MFGYVRPQKCQLRVCEWEFFRAAYCGLCHALARRYGFFSRFLLGYDFTCLAVALSAYEDLGPVFRKRCPANPFRRRSCLGGESFSLAADLSVLLFMGKLRDTVSDTSLLRSVPARLGLLFFRRAGRRAAERRPETHDSVTRQLLLLRDYEIQRMEAIDPPADAFATLLSGLASTLPDKSGRRILAHFFYHLGRWIYLMDAMDDLARDASCGSYNPVASRFGLLDGNWTQEAKDSLRETVVLSRRELGIALALLPDSTQTRILENIVGWGLPLVEEQVLAGVFVKKGLRHERSV